MTLANMRANGVRVLAVHCTICRHAAHLNVDRFDGSVPVPAFGPRMICTRCGIIGADARPNWTERANGERASPADSELERVAPSYAMRPAASSDSIEEIGVRIVRKEV